MLSRKVGGVSSLFSCTMNQDSNRADVEVDPITRQNIVNNNINLNTYNVHTEDFIPRIKSACACFLRGFNQICDV